MASTQAVINVDEVLILPASPSQQRFWVLDQLKKGDPSLNVAVRFRLEGDLNVAAMHRALNEIVRRHETLRANFSLEQERVAQIVSTAREIDLPVTDLRPLTPEERAVEADRCADAMARDSFALEHGPLLRARLLRLDQLEHVLLITIHHIVSDGWSIGVITDELGALYEEFCHGLPSPLPDLAVQYADVTLWKEEQAAAACPLEAESYWRERLKNLPHVEVMPDFPRTSGTNWPGYIVSRLLPKPLTEELRTLGREHNATLFMTMFAGLSALLQRYTGECDIVVGTQVAGRDAVETEPLIGPFTNTLVLRTDAGGDPSFHELLARSAGTVSGALAHEQVPFERVAEMLRAERNADRNLLFQINFIHQRDFVRPWKRAGITMTAIPSRSPGALFDLNLFMVERADGWRLSCEYNSALYRQDTVERLLEHYERMLGEIARAPYQRISEFHFLPPAEEMKLLAEWNDTAAPYPRDQCVHGLVENAARRTPDQAAAMFHGNTITYTELNARANRLARYLSARGAGRGVLVGICMDRSLDTLVALVAILKSGSGYVPLDPTLPPQRLAFMANDAELGVVLTKAAFADVIETKAPKVLMDSEAEAIGRESAGDYDGGATPECLAYVLFTSGSTGKPKGVAVEHRSVINELYAMQKHLELGPKDNVLAIATLTFDISVLEFFLPLLTGSRIVIGTHEEAADPAQLRQLVSAGEITLMQATPVTWRMLIEAGWRGSRNLKILCGAERLTRELADALLDRCGTLWNVYGPTETTVWATIAEIEANGEAISIGRPLANYLLYVLDPLMRPVPIGVPGELYIGGEGVTRGYQNRPELTAERFVPNPFAAGKMYRTGDRVRYWPDGRLELLGRTDDQVKIRGHRIELGEVEATLAACPGVRSAAVAVRKGAGGEDMLAGYFVVRPGEVATARTVRAWMGRHLPDYMIPTCFVLMDKLPVTPSGKLDRKILPSPELTATAAAREIGDGAVERPAEDGHCAFDVLEATLIGIWESVLDVRPIRKTDNFFALGGHSVLAARMFARMEKALGKSFPLATLFQGPTVEELAALIRDTDWTPLWSALVPIRPSGTKPPFFFVHPIGGNVLNFAGFCSYFDPDQPIYGLQARGLNGKEAPHTSVHAMAADYLKNIRAVQPEGPYYIGGFSAGGVVAFEMARQLRAEGQEVALLALLDTRLVTGSAGAEKDDGKLLRTLKFNIRYALRTPPAEYLARKAKNLRIRTKLRMWSIRTTLGLENSAASLTAEEGFLLALRHYYPEQYDGDATLFRARDEEVRYPDPNLGWGRVIRGRLDIQEVSGDHDTILLEPHIGILACRLVECLAAARGDGGQKNKAIRADREMTGARR